MSMPETTAIAVLGAGAWGTALSLALAKNRHRIQLWDMDGSLLEEMLQSRHNRYLPDVALPENIHICKTQAEALENTQQVLLVVPSHAFKKALIGIKPLLQKNQGLIWATKGLDPETGFLLHPLVESELGKDYPYALLSGPSFAKEVAVGLPTAVALASKNKSFAKTVAALFSHETFAVEITDDIIGVQLGGVVKNVLAVAVGISDGVQFGANTRAALITQGLAEMMQLGKALGARPETLMGLAGLGDTILTCTDNQSRNRRFGLALAEGLDEVAALKRIGQVVEAVHNVEQLCHLAKKYNILLPVTEQVYGVIKQGNPPKEAIASIFKTLQNSSK